MQTKHALKPEMSKSYQCIWMRAGVVRHRICRTGYQCQTCRFDRTLRRVAAENQALRQQGLHPPERRAHIVSWKEKLTALPPSRRPCIHHLKERIDFKQCTRDYHCGNCEFDQYFDDQFSVHAVLKPIAVEDVHGIKFPQGYYLHRGHTWARLEQNHTVRIGLDDFIQRLLGPFDRIETPLLGQTVRQGRPDIIVTRGDKTARVQAPVSGVVTGVNANLREKAGPAEQDPFGTGWAVTVQTNNLRQELRGLLIGGQSAEYIEQETGRLFDSIENSAGPLAADGGRISDNIFGKMPQLGWRRLVRQFLRTW